MTCSATLLALACALPGSLAAATSPVRILPLGDSITQANDGHDSYRRQLWLQLQAAGYAVDFVGGLSTPHTGSYAHGDFDPDHEGHWGWRVDEILDRIDAYAAASPHDLVLLHLGSNDMLQNQSVASTIDELSQLIDRLRAANPSVRILLAQIIPHGQPGGTPVDQLNAAIADLATSKHSGASPVVLVDQQTGFAVASDTYDSIHPDAGGEAKMAAVWFDALQPQLDELAAQVGQQPYGGSPQAIPGTIEICNYDLGGEGVAYHDSSTGNSGGVYRSDGVDISIDDGQASVGWTVGGEWLEYTVEVEAGTYDLELEASSATSGGDLQVLIDGQLVGTVTTAGTGGWGNYQTFGLQGVAIAASGTAVLRLQLVGSKDMYDLRRLRFTKQAPVRTPYGGVAQTIPGTIVCADYDEGGEGIAYHDSGAGNSGGVYRDDDVDISFDDGAASVGWTVGGEWLAYTVDVAAGSYQLQLEASSAKSGGDLEVLLDGQRLGIVSVSGTGSWGAFERFDGPEISIAEAGRKTLRLNLLGTKDMYDLRSLRFISVAKPEPEPEPEPEPTGQQPYGGIAQQIPGLIVLPDYDTGGEGIAYHDASSGNSGGVYRNDDVDLSIDDNQASIGWTAPGEWVEYTLDVTPGIYDLQLQASSAQAGGVVELLLDGTAIGTINVSNTGGWANFDTFTLPGVEIAASGRSVLRLEIAGGYDLRSLNVVAAQQPEPEPSGQQPYGGVAMQVPGLITLSDYDEGGEGVAYHDSTSGNAGSTYRSDDVDLSRDAGSVSVGWTTPGEWLEYTVDVTPGIYTLYLQAASKGGGEVAVSLGGKEIGRFTVVETGSWAIFREFALGDIAIDDSGLQELRLTMHGAGALFDLRSLEFRDALSDPGYGSGDPVDVHIDWSSYQRAKGYRGDNWCMTHAADGNLYTMMDDGHGFYQQEREWNSQMIRIAGGPDFTAGDTEACAGWPFMPAVTRFYGYGTYAIGQRIYTWLWMSERNGYNRPIANRLIYTDDFGQTFHRWDGTRVTEANQYDTGSDSFFFYKEQGQPKSGKTAYAFNWLAFCQNGQANSHADAIGDPYVYMYSVEQVDVSQMSMIRVHKDRVCDKSAYEYLVSVDANGGATWTSDASKRGATHVWPKTNYNGVQWSWASWQPSVVWNEGLQRYVMVAYGISDPGASYWAGWCNANSENSATVIMLHAEHPWGPWTEFHRDYEWKVPFPVPASEGFDADASRTYQFKLNPKWISDDGRSMWLHWSDAGGDWVNGHGHDRYWYNWNQVKIELDIDPDTPDGNG